MQNHNYTFLYKKVFTTETDFKNYNFINLYVEINFDIRNS